MDHQDQDQNNPSARPSAPTEPDARPEDRDETSGPIVIGTDNPMIASGGGMRTAWTAHPDRSMVIETNRIVEPQSSYSPGLVMVPVEFQPSEQSKNGKDSKQNNGSGKDADSKKTNPDQDSAAHGKSNGQEKSKKNIKPDRSQAPSLIRTMLIPAVVAAVCGLAGAAGYSYFFGSSKSDDPKSSGKDSGSRKQSGSDSSKGSGSSGSGQDSRSSENGATKNQIHMAEQAWMTAVNELHQVQNSEKEARRAEADTRAVLDFLKKTLLSAGRPGDTSLSEAFWAEGKSKDVSLKKAIDVAEAQVAEAFAERPVAEASARETLGFAYLNIGQPAQAVTQYERALALREAMLGASQPDTSAVRNQLAVAYRLASRTDEAGRLFDRNLNSPNEAAALAVRGAMLLFEKKPADAELKLRDCLTIRQKTQPDNWTTFDTMSTLGEALLAQKKYADAEPMLLAGFQGMKKREGSIPTQDKPRIVKALERLTKLYESMGKADKALEWRKQMEAAQAPEIRYTAPSPS